jgi:hypothetical protein
MDRPVTIAAALALMLALAGQSPAEATAGSKQDASVVPRAAAFGLPGKPPRPDQPVEPALGVAASAAVFDELRSRINILQDRVEALEDAVGINGEDLPPLEYSDPHGLREQQLEQD